jgi:uncharacterized protein with ATP-grasp and redox domains
MKTYLDCIPCFFKQALEAARLAGASAKTQKRVIDELAKALPEFPLTSSPPEMGRIIYQLINKITRTKDPYLALKDKGNQLALDMEHALRKKINNSHDRLLTATELSILGNIIDYGAKNMLDVEAEMAKILEEENRVKTLADKDNFHYMQFREGLGEARTILYLADNAGEVVFDKILIEEIRRYAGNKKIIYAVKEKPIINDALIDDAYVCGMPEIAGVISCGADAPGTILSLCSRKFLEIYNRAEMIISKGQGNFEALSLEKRPIFFLFMAKCPVIAREVGCNVGEMILIGNSA